MNKFFFNVNETPVTALSWGESKWLCDPEISGYQGLSSCYVTVKPGEGHLTHTHPSDEILYFLAGTGKQTVLNECQNVSPGSFVYIPANIKHQTLNTGNEPLVFLAVYSPAIKT